MVRLALVARWTWIITVLVIAIICFASLKNAVPYFVTEGVVRDEYSASSRQVPPTALPYVTPSLGTWQLDDGDKVGWVRFTDSHKQPMEEIAAGDDKDGATPPPCKHETDAKSNSSELCVLWRARPRLQQPAKSLWSGVLAASLALHRSSDRAMMLLRLVPHHSMRVAADAITVSFRGKPPAELGEAEKWMAFGYMGEQYTQLHSLFPGKSDRYATRLIDRFLDDGLDAKDSMQLFARVYASQTHENHAAHLRVSTDSQVSRREADDGVLRQSCFWLVEVSFDVTGHNISREATMQGRAWSTCGDRLTLATTTQRYNSFLSRVNLAAFAFLAAAALPFFVGLTSQLAWTRNSRGRTLRMSLWQMFVLIFWISVDLSLITLLWMRAPQARKSFAMLYIICFVGMLLMVLLIMLIEVERARYMEQQESASSRVQMFMLLYATSWLGATFPLLLKERLTNVWVVALGAATFWLAQWAHNVKLGSWTGLTPIFLTGSAAIVVLPMLLTITLSPEPWVLEGRDRLALGAAAAFIVAETVLLVLFCATKGRHLLPSRFAPWRHDYATTCEAQRAALQESPLCPICRSALSEGWSEHDELWRTPCNHLFHRSCLERWMMERMECPLCRTLLPEP